MLQKLPLAGFCSTVCCCFTHSFSAVLIPARAVFSPPLSFSCSADPLSAGVQRIENHLLLLAVQLFFRAQWDKTSVCKSAKKKHAKIMFSVRISNHNPFSNFGVAVTPPKFGDLGRSKKAKRKSSSSGSSGGSGDDSFGEADTSGKTEFLVIWYREYLK